MAWQAVPPVIDPSVIFSLQCIATFLAAFFLIHWPICPYLSRSACLSQPAFCPRSAHLSRSAFCAHSECDSAECVCPSFAFALICDIGLHGSGPATPRRRRPRLSARFPPPPRLCPACPPPRCPLLACTCTHPPLPQPTVRLAPAPPTGCAAALPLDLCSSNSSQSVSHIR